MATSKPKFIFVTGGVISSLGKGLTASSLALLLKKRGLKVKCLKMDPYLNVDPGTMSPIQHGEVFVTDDGAETDLDLGNYERFTGENVSSDQNITTGKIYEQVLAKEREGKYLGATVQVIPHITDEIKNHIYKIAKGVDVLITEVGGTVGDIESLPFLEAIRQVKFDLAEDSVCYIHVTLVPFIKAAGELKTKPTQHSVQELRRIGIQPDCIMCRTDRNLPKNIKQKLALFTNLHPSSIFENRDTDSIYQLPLDLNKDGLDQKVCQLLNIKKNKVDLKSWSKFVSRIRSPKKIVQIAMVGKYVENQDSYVSLNEALKHSAAFLNAKLELTFIDSEIINKSSKKIYKHFENIDGILVPGGFGSRGVNGKIKTIKFAREQNIPFLGICLGMQLAVVEFARNVAGITKAHSSEFVKNKFNVIDFIDGQKEVKKGASMRLGAYDCSLVKNTLAFYIYEKSKISERHRHRLEVQNKFLADLKSSGLIVSGVNKKKNLVEIIELENHPWFLGCQFHPEFKSRPEASHPIFDSFLQAAIKFNKKY